MPAPTALQQAPVVVVEESVVQDISGTRALCFLYLGTPAQA